MLQAPVYYADPYADWLDDFAMTFQIVLVGKDGIVLGSDRLFAERGLRALLQKQRTTLQRTTGTKICTAADNAVVCSFAGGPYSETIARRIVTDCNPLGRSDIDWRNCLEVAAKNITDYEEHIVDEVFVIRTDNRSVVKIIRQQKDDPTFTPVTGHMFSGIETDAIIVPKLFWRADMECDELRTLAVVAVVLASQEAPHLIGGGID